MEKHPLITVDADLSFDDLDLIRVCLFREHADAFHFLTPSGDEPVGPEHDASLARGLLWLEAALARLELPSRMAFCVDDDKTTRQLAMIDSRVLDKLPEEMTSLISRMLVRGAELVIRDIESPATGPHELLDHEFDMDPPGLQSYERGQKAKVLGDDPSTDLIAWRLPDAERLFGPFNSEAHAIRAAVLWFIGKEPPDVIELGAYSETVDVVTRIARAFMVAPSRFLSWSEVEALDIQCTPQDLGPSEPSTAADILRTLASHPDGIEGLTFEGARGQNGKVIIELNRPITFKYPEAVRVTTDPEPAPTSWAWKTAEHSAEGFETRQAAEHSAFTGIEDKPSTTDATPVTFSALVHGVAVEHTLLFGQLTHNIEIRAASEPAPRWAWKCNEAIVHGPFSGLRAAAEHCLGCYSFQLEDRHLSMLFEFGHIWTGEAGELDDESFERQTQATLEQMDELVSRPPPTPDLATKWPVVHHIVSESDPDLTRPFLQGGLIPAYSSTEVAISELREHKGRLVIEYEKRGRKIRDIDALDDTVAAALLKGEIKGTVDAIDTLDRARGLVPQFPAPDEAEPAPHSWGWQRTIDATKHGPFESQMAALAHLWAHYDGTWDIAPDSTFWVGWFNRGDDGDAFVDPRLTMTIKELGQLVEPRQPDPEGEAGRFEREHGVGRQTIAGDEPAPVVWGWRTRHYKQEGFSNVADCVDDVVEFNEGNADELPIWFMEPDGRECPTTLGEVRQTYKASEKLRAMGIRVRVDQDLARPSYPTTPEQLLKMADLNRQRATLAKDAVKLGVHPDGIDDFVSRAMGEEPAPSRWGWLSQDATFQSPFASFTAAAAAAVKYFFHMGKAEGEDFRIEFGFVEPGDNSHNNATFDHRGVQQTQPLEWLRRWAATYGVNDPEPAPEERWGWRRWGARYIQQTFSSFSDAVDAVLQTFEYADEPESRDLKIEFGKVTESNAMVDEFIDGIPNPHTLKWLREWVQTPTQDRYANGGVDHLSRTASDLGIDHTDQSHEGGSAPKQVGGNITTKRMPLIPEQGDRSEADPIEGDPITQSLVERHDNEIAALGETRAIEKEEAENKGAPAAVLTIEGPSAEVQRAEHIAKRIIDSCLCWQVDKSGKRINEGPCPVHPKGRQPPIDTAYKMRPSVEMCLIHGKPKERKFCDVCMGRGAWADNGPGEISAAMQRLPHILVTKKPATIDMQTGEVKDPGDTGLKKGEAVLSHGPEATLIEVDELHEDEARQLIENMKAEYYGMSKAELEAANKELVSQLQGFLYNGETEEAERIRGFIRGQIEKGHGRTVAEGMDAVAKKLVGGLSVTKAQIDEAAGFMERGAKAQIEAQQIIDDHNEKAQVTRFGRFADAQEEAVDHDAPTSDHKLSIKEKRDRMYGQNRVEAAAPGRSKTENFKAEKGVGVYQGGPAYEQHVKDMVAKKIRDHMDQPSIVGQIAKQLDETQSDEGQGLADFVDGPLSSKDIANRLDQMSEPNEKPLAPSQGAEVGEGAGGAVLDAPAARSPSLFDMPTAIEATGYDDNVPLAPKSGGEK